MTNGQIQRITLPNIFRLLQMDSEEEDEDEEEKACSIIQMK